MKTGCLLVFTIMLISKIWSAPIFYEGFETGKADQLLPRPWIHKEDKQGNKIGAIIVEQGLSLPNTPGKGKAVGFLEHRRLSGALFEPIKLLKKYNRIFYLSALVQPQVDPDKGWGVEPVCLAVTNAENQRMDGFWIGIVQDNKGQLGPKGRDYFAISTGQQPSRGFGADHVKTFTEYGPVENGKTYFCVTKFVIEGGREKNMMRGYMNIYTEGRTIPEIEPEQWDYSKEDSERGHPFGGNKPMNLLVVNRANTSSSAVFDEIRLGQKWEDVVQTSQAPPPSSTGSQQTNETQTPERTDSAEPAAFVTRPGKKIRAADPEIQMEEINSGHFIAE
ncbi:MAG: hypothetical protein ACOCVL_00855 [Candidatus Sumerlaeota bacterium]